ncbi:MAG: MAPEG family protein [Pseudomonadota bacterium]|nr:MAPEG family protein [Pseudomonadota bacterium]
MNTAFLYPVLVQVALTFALVIATGLTRTAAIRRGEVKVSEVALGQKKWPKRSMQFSNAYQNQLETPILFYAGILFAGAFGVAGPVLLALAWVWVGVRLVHVAIHITINHMLYRFMAFLTGVIVLAAFWIVMAVEVITR